MQNRFTAALTSKSGLGALLLFILAGVTFSEVVGLRLGTPDAMGPGYFPALLGVLFILFGCMLLVEGWQNPNERVEFGQIRPVIYLLGAIVLFGVTYPFLGGAIAIALLLVVSALAERGRTLRELVTLVIVVVAMVWLIFVVALNLQLSMLPPWVTS